MHNKAMLLFKQYMLVRETAIAMHGAVHRRIF